MRNPEVKIMKGDFWQKLPNNEHVKRALEIAMAGGHKTLIIISPDIKRMFVEFLQRLPAKFKSKFVKIAYQCPCGYYAHLSQECICEIPEIKRYIRGLKLWNYDIVIEATLPRERDYFSVGEPFSDVQERIKLMADYDSFDVDESSRQLLRLGKEKLNADVGVAVNVARTIANLDHHKSLSPTHVAEALQYQSHFAEFK